MVFTEDDKAFIKILYLSIGPIGYGLRKLMIETVPWQRMKNVCIAKIGQTYHETA